MQNKERAPTITLQDRLTLSPTEKYIIYGTFPWKMVVNIALLVFTTLQVILLINTLSLTHNRNQLRVFKKLFLDDEKQVFTKTFLTPKQLQEHLSSVIEEFRNMNESMYQDVDFTNTQFSIESYLTDYSQLTNESQHVIHQIDNIYDPIEIPFNISDQDSVKDYSDSVYRIVLVADQVQTYILENHTKSPCIAWNISLAYDFTTLSDVDVTLQALPSYCSKTSWVDDGFQNYTNNTPVIHLIVLVTAIVLIILNMRYFYKLSTIYMNMKMNYQKMIKKRRNPKIVISEVTRAIGEVEPESVASNLNPELYREVMEDTRDWDELPYSMKLKLFDPWYYFSTVGALIQILAALIILADQIRSNHTEYHKGQLGLVGLGNFFAWMQLLCYLGYNQNLTLITTILSKSTKTILIFYGVYIPIFLSYGLLGHALFWKYENFESTGTTLQKLFALAGGDIVHEVFCDVASEGPFKQIYLFFYLIMFFTAFQNIFVAVIMDGYEMSKIRKAIDNNNPFPSPQSAQKAVKEKRIKINDTDSDNSPDKVVSSQLQNSWKSPTLSPLGQGFSLSPQFDITASPNLKMMDDFKLDSPAESLRDQKKQIYLLGLDGQEEPKTSPRTPVQPSRSIITDFLSKELRPEKAKSDNNAEATSIVLVEEPEDPSDERNLRRYTTNTVLPSQNLEDLNNSQIRKQSTFGADIKPKLSKEEAAIANLREMTRSIIQNIKIMKQEASDFPPTSDLGVQEKKYLQRIFFSKLNAVTSKIAYITSLDR